MTKKPEPSEVLLPMACLTAFTRTGQDKAAVQRLTEALVADLVPRNLVEHMWIRDIAVLTIRSEELRLAQIAVHKLLVQGITASLPKRAEDKGVAGEGVPDEFEVELQPLEQVLARTHLEHFAMIQALAAMEVQARAERDRVMYVYDRRRGIDMNAVIQFVRETLEDKHDEPG